MILQLKMALDFRPVLCIAMAVPPGRGMWVCDPFSECCLLKMSLLLSYNFATCGVTMRERTIILLGISIPSYFLKNCPGMLCRTHKNARTEPGIPQYHQE